MGSILQEVGWELGLWTAYTALGWTSSGTAPTINTTAANLHTSMSSNGGAYSLSMTGTAVISPRFSGTPKPKWVSFWLKPILNSGHGTGLTFYQYNGTTRYQQVSVQFSRGSSGKAPGIITIESSGLYVQAWGSFNSNVPHWISVGMVCGNPGSAVVYVDGEKVVDATGIQTNYALYGLVDWVHYGFTNIYAGINSYVDDIIVHDDTFVGPCPEHYTPGIIPVTPDDNSPVGCNELTPSTGTTHYNLVDERPPNTTDYNSATAVNQQDTYQLGTLTWTPDAIACIGVWAYAVRADGPNITKAKLITKRTTDVCDYSSDKVFVAANTWQAVENVVELNPETAAAWVKADIDSLRAGIEFL